MANPISTRVLIADADDAFCDWLATELAAMGHVVAGRAATAAQAVALAAEVAPELVMLDITLDGWPAGIEVAFRVQQCSNASIVLIGPALDDAGLRHAMLSEPRGYLVKPFAGSQLRATIHVALSTHEVERRMREHGRSHAVMLSSIGDAVIATDAGDHITFVNPAAEALTGWTRVEVTGKPLADVFQIVDEACGTPAEDPAASVLRYGTVRAFPSRAIVVARGGVEIPVDGCGSPIVGEDGSVKGVVLVFRDITERRRAEQADALRVTNLRLENAMKGSNIGVWEVDMPDGDFINGRTSFGNICTHLGYRLPKQRITPEAYLRLMHPQDRTCAESAIAAYLMGVSKTFELESRILHRSGSYRWMLTRGTVERDLGGCPVRFVGTIVDITELKEAEQALRESEERFRGTFENAAVGIAHCDMEGRLLRVNRRYCEIVGYQRHVVLGMKAEDLVLADYRETRVARLADLEAGRISSYSEEVPVRRKDGTQVWVNVSVALQRDVAGIPVHTISTIEDISGRRALEDTVRAAKEYAERANRAKDKLLANVSHELRTPLNGILGYTQLLKRDAALTQRQSASLGVIEESGKHLLTLINDLLDISLIEAGKLELYVSDVFLASFLNSIVGLIRVRAEQKNLRLRYHADARLPPVVRIDERRLRQILLNLLANAVRFTDHGEIGLCVSVSENQRLQFDVSDTGIGIEPDQFDAIFRPFIQVNGLARRTGGAGLGLAISRELVRAMGSDIHVQSRPGAGSRFWFELDAPVSERKPDSIAVQPTVDGYKGKRCRVLIVDDVEANRLVMRDALCGLGFDVLEADSASVALSLAHQQRPDLILLDTIMPDMDGVELLVALRRNNRLANTPVVAVSADASQRNRMLNLEAGANDFIQKPLDIPELLGKIAVQLGLEWTYRDEAEPDDCSCFAVPAWEDLQALHRFALIGSMREIMQCASAIESKDPGYAPFVRQIRHLASNYESQALLSLIERHLTSSS
jgi:PAS domain S-box-containing protein